MTILQVNVRPAAKLRKSAISQRRESADTSDARHAKHYQLIQATAVNHASDPYALQQQGYEHHMINEAAGVTPTPLYEDEVPVSLPQAPTTPLHPAVNGAGEPSAAPITNGGAAEPLLKPPTTWQKIIWKLMPFTTVGRALNSARERLNEAGCAAASLDAQVILAYVLGVDRSWLFAHHEYKLSAEQADAFTDLIGRRMAHEPVAYLIGKREFYGIEFTVDQRVLIPRPETELLVDAVLDYAADSGADRVVVADVGTGSGAIALSVACNWPTAHIYAIDVSDAALEVAHTNVERLDERGQVVLAHGDLLTPLPERVHIIVANLPYISSEIYPQLDADVRDFEPQLALEAGPEGLDAIQRLLRQASHYLLPDGVIFLEIGFDQGPSVAKLAATVFPAAQTISVRKDYHGHDRLVTIVP